MGWFREHAAGVRKAVRWLALIVVILTAVQPFLGSRGFFSSSDASLSAHEGIANLLFLLALILVPLTFLGQFERRWTMVGWSVGLLVAISAQIGLGYSTRDNMEIVTYHITLGVLIFGAALILTLLSYGLRLSRQDEGSKQPMNGDAPRW